MQRRSVGLLQLHVAILCFGLAGVVGDASALAAQMVTFGRTLFASLALGVVLLLLHSRAKQTTVAAVKPDNSIILMAAGSGVLLALHWYCFFHSIELSTVAVGLICFSSCAVFSAVLEPLVFRERFQLRILFAAFGVVCGLLVLLGFEPNQGDLLIAVAWGISGALLFSVLQMGNRYLLTSISSISLSLLQVAVASVVFLPFVLHELAALSSRNWMQLAFLGIVCTALAHTLFIASLQRIKTWLANTAAAGLEPVYGTVLAALLLTQWPSAAVITGGCIVLAAVVFTSLQTDAH